MRDVLLLVAGALIGFVSGRVNDWMDRTRRRKSLATALLVELRHTEAALRPMYADIPGLIPSGAFSTWEQLGGESLALLAPTTVVALYDFRSSLLSATTAMSDVLAGNTARSAFMMNSARVGAYFAIKRAETLKAELEREGGVLPERKEVDHSSLQPDFPPLSPSVFGSLDSAPALKERTRVDKPMTEG